MSQSIRLKRIRLGDYVTKIGSGATPKGGQESYKKEGIALIRSQNIHNNLFVYDGLAFIDEQQASLLDNVQVKENDVLLNITGASVGRVCQVPQAVLPARVNQHVAIIRTKPNRIYPKFLRYYLLSPSMQFLISKLADLGSTRQALTRSMIANLPIDLPSLSEQKDIANFLDVTTEKIDTLIEKKQRLLDLLAERRQALISHVVTKGLNPDVPMKPSGVEWIGDIPKHWHTNLLKFVCSINPRMRNRVKQDSDSMVTFLPMEKIGEKGELILEEERPLHEVIQGFTYFEENDVLIAKITPCFENGKGAIAKCLKNKLGFGTTELHVLRPSTAITSEYLYYLTQSDYFRLPGIAMMEGAAGQKRLKVDYLKKFIMVIPPKAEQYIIVGYLNEKTAKIDCLMQKVEQAIELLKERRTALISEAVTGKINVSDGVQSYDISNLTA